MALIESELGGALTAPVKRKANSTRKLRSSPRQQAKRVASGTTEVMVKITGFGKGAGHVKAHLDYVSRNGKLELENDRGEILSGRAEVKELFDDWKQDFGDARRHKNQRDTMHLMLSMPEGTDPEAVRRATREFCKISFGQNHEYVFALHTDEPHPHCHVTVKMRGFDGSRLNPRKDDLQAWREGFAAQLREQGVAAEATPRRARGVVRKAESSVVRHIEAGDKTHKPRVPQVKAAAVREAAQELAKEAKGVPAVARPWEEAIKARQASVRAAWMAAAAALEREGASLTFNSKEARNERPDYERIGADRARSTQRAAALYQSHLGKTGRSTPAQSLASVRNLSGVPLVYDQRPAQVLLQSNAPDRVGEGRAAGDEVRRARAGDPAARGGARTLDRYTGSAKESQALAASIRSFVEAMPAPETQKHGIKQALAQKFGRQLDRLETSTGDAGPQPNVGRTDAASQVVPDVRKKEAER